MGLPPIDPDPVIFTAVREQLGLKLEPQKDPSTSSSSIAPSI